MVFKAFVAFINATNCHKLTHRKSCDLSLANFLAH